MPTSSPRYFVDNLRLTPQSACYCGGASSFAECCGKLASDRSPPSQLTIISDFLSQAERGRLLRFAKKQDRKWLTMIDIEKSTATRNVQVRDPGRVTQAVNMDKREPVLQAMFRKALLEQVGPVFGFRPEMFEPPYVLRYPPGGKYILHCDSDEYDRGAKRWYRLRDRDVSLLIYLNDDYEGGELKFDHLNYTYHPKAGDLVFFPSNHRFSHQSLPIRTGFKWSIVSWSCFAHTPRVTSGLANWNTLTV